MRAYHSNSRYSNLLGNVQGALYILGERLVQQLNSVRDILLIFPMEDAMVGTWLLGFDKVTSVVAVVVAMSSHNNISLRGRSM